MHFTATFRANPPPQAAGMDVDEVPAAGSRPDRLVDVRPQERVQRRTVEQLVDAAPCLPALDAPVPLVVEQLADVLSLVAKYEAEMDRLEDLILTGAHVSAAEKAAWRRWALRSGESSSRRKKKRKKKKLPRGYSQCKTVQKTGRLHRSKGLADVHAATSSSSSSFLVPCSQFIDRVWTSRCAQRRLPSVQTAQQTGEILQVQLLDWFGRPSLCNDRLDGADSAENVDVPQVQYFDRVVDVPAAVHRQCLDVPVILQRQVHGDSRRCLRFSSSQELDYDGSDWVFGAFCAIFRAPPVIRS